MVLGPSRPRKMERHITWGPATPHFSAAGHKTSKQPPRTTAGTASPGHSQPGHQQASVTQWVGHTKTEPVSPKAVAHRPPGRIHLSRHRHIGTQPRPTPLRLPPWPGFLLGLPRAPGTAHGMRSCLEQEFKLVPGGPLASGHPSSVLRAREGMPDFPGLRAIAGSAPLLQKGPSGKNASPLTVQSHRRQPASGVWKWGSSDPRKPQRVHVVRMESECSTGPCCPAPPCPASPRNTQGTLAKSWHCASSPLPTPAIRAWGWQGGTLKAKVIQAERHLCADTPGATSRAKLCTPRPEQKLTEKGGHQSAAGQWPGFCHPPAQSPHTLCTQAMFVE